MSGDSPHGDVAMPDRTDPDDPAAREPLHPPPSASDDRTPLDPPAANAAGTMDSQSRPSNAGAPTLPSSFGRFLVRDILGEDYIGTVYRAYDPDLHRPVALKVTKAVALNPEGIRRLSAEAQVWANLLHPNLAPLFQWGIDNDHLFFATFFEGMTLQDLLHEPRGEFLPRAAAGIVHKLADVLAYVHAQGVIHRDVKSANVIIDLVGEPHLLAFGLALCYEMAERATQERAVMGTPAYLAPELAKGDLSMSGPATDQYALGCLLYEMLTGRTPFAGPVDTVLYLHLTREPEPPSKSNLMVPLVPNPPIRRPQRKN
jgi:serine/threonine protein kinase